MKKCPFQSVKVDLHFLFLFSTLVTVCMMDTFFHTDQENYKSRQFKSESRFHLSSCPARTAATGTMRQSHVASRDMPTGKNTAHIVPCLSNGMVHIVPVATCY